LVRQAAQKKTLAYMALGTQGWLTAMVKAVLCNWMVTLGAVLALVSRSTFGKVVAMWLPIMMFFALGYEHSIVNMYVIPAGRMLGAPVSMGKWWLWNQIPVTLGNIFAGVVLTAWAFYATYHTKPSSAPAEPAALSPALVPPALATEPARLA
jgi:formate transporter